MNPTIGRSLAALSLALALAFPAAAADTSAPTAPRQLTASSTPTEVTLHWGNSKDDIGVTGYRVERCNGAGCTAFGEIGTSRRTTFVDGAVANGASYRYRVRATDVAGNRSAFSRPVDVTVGDGGPSGNPGPSGDDNRAPRAPRSLTATASGARITLRWSAARDNVGVTGYLVQRCQGAGCANFVNRVQVGAVTSFVDTGLAGGTTFQYRVRGVDAAGNAGAFSPVATARTQGSGNPPPPPPPPPPPGQALSPQAVALTFSQSQQFSTSLSGASWSVDGVPGGSAAVGTISASGVYSPPDAVGKHTVRATAGGQSATATVYVTNYAGKFTQQNDNARTGQNLGETVLSPDNVSSDTFGKLFSYALDGLAYASPLYVANVNIAGQGIHNVVYVATEHNSVYAFDADGRQAAPLWKKNFNNPAAGVTPVPPGETEECCDIMPEIGITGTPVIDAATRTIYFVVKTKEIVGGNAEYVQRLHALDLGSGSEKFGGPAEIGGRVPGTGSGAAGGFVEFVPLRQNQRPGLLLSRGVVYVAFGSHGDHQPYHGWVFGYDAGTLNRTLIWNATPNAEGGGIWQGGGALAGDAGGSIYFVTGDGTFTQNVGGVDYGDSFVKLSPAGAVLDFFTPHDEATLDAADTDLGSGGLLLIPDQGDGRPPLLVEAGKNGRVYLVNRNDMGKFHTNTDAVVQTLPVSSKNLSSPVYFKGSIYLCNVVAPIQEFKLSQGLLGAASQTAESYNYPGAAMAISANGGNNGILWAIQSSCPSDTSEACTGTTAQGVLRAYDAENLSARLYSSDEKGSRDALDIASKFSQPAIANGKVFVGSNGRLTVYGLLP